MAEGLSFEVLQKSRAFVLRPRIPMLNDLHRPVLIRTQQMLTSPMPPPEASGGAAALTFTTSRNSEFRRHDLINIKIAAFPATHRW